MFWGFEAMKKAVFQFFLTNIVGKKEHKLWTGLKSQRLNRFSNLCLQTEKNTTDPNP